MKEIEHRDLSSHEITLVEVAAVLHVTGVAIDLNGLAMILKYTAGVYVAARATSMRICFIV